MRGLTGFAVLMMTAALATACASSPMRPVDRSSRIATDDDVVSSDLHELMTVIRTDLTLHRNRDRDRVAASLPSPARSGSPSSVRDLTARNVSPFEGGISSRRIVMGPALMPVAGVQSRDLVDTWGAPRDGGRRRHRGIDIFAPKGTQIYAIADGVITYVGVQPKGGKCLWLSTEDGMAFYYAHLDRWAAGIYEGMEVSAGTVLGYVGNTGNAKHTPPHLHLAVRDGDETLNPYTFLRRGRDAAAPSGGVVAAGGR